MSDVVEINAKTGEVTERAFTPEEKAQRAADRAEQKARDDAEKAERQAKRALRKSAEAKLLALGLTADEAAALAGE